MGTLALTATTRQNLLHLLGAVSIIIKFEFVVNFEFDGCLQVIIIYWRESLLYDHIHQSVLCSSSIKININKRLVNLKNKCVSYFFYVYYYYYYYYFFFLRNINCHIRRRRCPNKRVAADAHRR